ncbi:MAG: pirin family protein [Pseudomonadota bacterium]|nr:pirin family protein [Pseudomonadota bacterium]
MSAILAVRPLGFVWETEDPFLFCVHHDDAYPAGDERMAPAASLAGRDLGQDFAGRDGWRMYHGRVIPGFPQHPHRGFETVTLARRGYIDHSDSLGATARFGGGDAQWMTAGAGISHSEMFPLIERAAPNPLELFQIWLNLPRADKLVPPHFSMLWNEGIPRVTAEGVEVTVVAGVYDGHRAPQPPPRSWAARPDTDVAIWTVRLAPHARWALPVATAGVNRNLYVFEGGPVTVDGRVIAPPTGIKLRPDVAVTVENGAAPSELLLLQGRPIKEPVVQHGPFVMNTPTEIHEAFAEYRRTRFGGWPWRSDDPVHARDAGRFAVHADGREERPGTLEGAAAGKG